MKLLKEISSSQNDYAKKLERIAGKVEQWLGEMAKEKRLGLGTLDQIIAEAGGDPYNTADQQRAPQSDTVDFNPQADTQKPVLNKAGGNTKIHLIYDPKTGEVGKVIKTSLMSRPPAEYMEATADQVQGALKHLERINPKLADLLVNGSMSIWIPRSGTLDPNATQSLRALGMQNAGGTTKKEMTPDRLAAARAGADKMSTV